MQQQVHRNNYPQYTCLKPEGCFYAHGAGVECIGCPHLKLGVPRKEMSANETLQLYV